VSKGSSKKLRSKTLSKTPPKAAFVRRPFEKGREGRIYEKDAQKLEKNCCPENESTEMLKKSAMN